MVVTLTAVNGATEMTMTQRGAQMSDALRQIEAFEFLFECELKTRSVMNRQG